MAAHPLNATALLMKNSFAQFRRSLCVLIGVFALVMCMAIPAAAQSVAEVEAAQQAVMRAEQAYADQYAPELMNSARQILVQAQAAALNRRERKKAPALAIRAHADADLAHARSEEAVALAQLQQRQTEIAELQRTLGLEATP